jgi:hypothetical protein
MKHRLARYVVTVAPQPSVVPRLRSHPFIIITDARNPALPVSTPAEVHRKRTSKFAVSNSSPCCILPGSPQQQQQQPLPLPSWRTAPTHTVRGSPSFFSPSLYLTRWLICTTVLFPVPVGDFRFYSLFYYFVVASWPQDPCCNFTWGQLALFPISAWVWFIENVSDVICVPVVLHVGTFKILTPTILVLF